MLYFIALDVLLGVFFYMVLSFESAFFYSTRLVCWCFLLCGAYFLFYSTDWVVGAFFYSTRLPGWFLFCMLLSFIALDWSVCVFYYMVISFIARECLVGAFFYSTRLVGWCFLLYGTFFYSPRLVGWCFLL